jgi:Zn-dependent protease
MKFSNIELQHLGRAWLAISFAFGILFSRGDLFSLNFFYVFLVSGFTVGLGFLLHELMHKYFAQRYGCYAEFRAFDNMLLLAIVMSFFGFIFAAPGAVMIRGYVSVERNGKISLAGPMANIVLALIFLIILQTGYFSYLASFGFFVNSLLAAFNMIPFWNFDGSKVLKWNKGVYFVVLIISLILFVVSSGSV